MKTAKYTFDFDPEEHAKFKLKCAVARRTMTGVLRDLMKAYQPRRKANTNKE